MISQERAFHSSICGFSLSGIRKNGHAGTELVSGDAMAVEQRIKQCCLLSYVQAAWKTSFKMSDIC